MAPVFADGNGDSAWNLPQCHQGACYRASLRPYRSSDDRQLDSPQGRSFVFRGLTCTAAADGDLVPPARESNSSITERREFRVELHTAPRLLISSWRIPNDSPPP